jgi:hypothetical protein
MSYFLNPVEEKECVFLTCEGIIPDAKTEVVLAALRALLVWKQWHRIVVDLTAMRSSNPGDPLNIGISLLRGVLRGARVALIVRPDQAMRARLLEKTARHDGVFLAFFLDADKAEAWVQNDTPKRTHDLTTCIPKINTNELIAERTI